MSEKIGEKTLTLGARQYSVKVYSLGVPKGTVGPYPQAKAVPILHVGRALDPFGRRPSEYALYLYAKYEELETREYDCLG